MPNNEIADLLTEFNGRRRETESWHRTLQSKIEELEKAIEELPNFASSAFLTEILAPALKKAIPGYEFEVLGPFGLADHYGVHMKDDNGKTVASLHLEARADVESGDIWFSQLIFADEGDYPKGSIGAASGLNHRSQPLPKSLDEIVNLLKEQLQKRAA